jgi:hypothetical protein
VKQGLILVEGQTEEAFVTAVLSPYLSRRAGLWLEPTIVTTKRVTGGPSFKGGVRRYEKIRNDLIRLFRPSHVAVVTTLFDYYRFPVDAPGMVERSKKPTALQKVQAVQAALAADVSSPLFVPFLALHELEAWLFCDLQGAEWAFPEGSRLDELREIRAQFNSPEEINEAFETAPSRRVLAACPAYQKATDGTVVLEAIGIDAIRRECPHFAQWLDQLERIAAA